MPSKTKENYLKAAYFLCQKSNNILLTDLANKMNVSKPTANNMVKKMEQDGWLKYEKYKPIKLSSKGKKMGALIVRKHRLTEMFLSIIMDFGWEEVHEIAEEMEHLNSQKLFDRMDEILGYPTLDPHGSPIPDKEGKIIKPNYVKLTSINIGEKVRLCALSKSSHSLLILLNKKEIKLGQNLEILHIETFDSSYQIRLSPQITVELTEHVCDCLLVEYIK